MKKEKVLQEVRHIVSLAVERAEMEFEFDFYTDEERDELQKDFHKALYKFIDKVGE